MEKTNKLTYTDKITVSLLADMVKIEQGTLSNYMSGRRQMKFDVAMKLEKITGIENQIWLKASWSFKTSEKQEFSFELRKRLGMVGTTSERNLNNKMLIDNYNKYMEKNEAAA